MADRAPSGVTMVTKPKPRGLLARATGRLTSTTLPWAENISIRSLCVVVAARFPTYNLVFISAVFLEAFLIVLEHGVKITCQDTSMGSATGRVVRLHARSERSAAAFA